MFCQFLTISNFQRPKYRENTWEFAPSSPWCDRLLDDWSWSPPMLLWTSPSQRSNNFWDTLIDGRQCSLIDRLIDALDILQLHRCLDFCPLHQRLYLDRPNRVVALCQHRHLSEHDSFAHSHDLGRPFSTQHIAYPATMNLAALIPILGLTPTGVSSPLNDNDDGPARHTSGKRPFSPGPRGPLVPVAQPGLGNRD